MPKGTWEPLHTSVQWVAITEEGDENRSGQTQLCLGTPAHLVNTPGVTRGHQTSSIAASLFHNLSPRMEAFEKNEGSSGQVL